MKQFARCSSYCFVFWILLFAGCLSCRAQAPADLYEAWNRNHITTIAPSQVRHKDLQSYLQRLRSERLPVREVGRSVANREIYQIEFGNGPLKVFMWSQMHGDEPTATSALVDLLHYLQRHRDEPWVKRISNQITLRAVPMLNPDGAELYQRRNLQGIDINRDARLLTTPEGRLLKRLRDEWNPHIGFNLHNQQARTAVGNTGKQATISFLAVPFDEAGTDDAGRLRNKKLCSVMTSALVNFIPGHIGRYDDTFNPRAFGDMISRWGTPVILIETGALHGASELDLVRLNFVAYATALDALATGRVDSADPKVYESLRYNRSGSIYSLKVRNATIINNASPISTPPYTTDLLINEDIVSQAGRLRRRATIADVGDLKTFNSLEEIDATNYYVLNRNYPTRPGSEAALTFYRKDRITTKDLTASGIERRTTPDATYHNGEWSGRDSVRLRSKSQTSIVRDPSPQTKLK